MKKVKFFFFALLLTGLGFSEVLADVQIDEGQAKGTAPIQFFVGRYARTGAVATAGGYRISKDSVVIWDATSADGVTIQTSTTSGDSLRAGITLDEIPGSSRDNTAAEDEGYNNWGRIQTWGLGSNVRALNEIDAGEHVCVSGTAQSVVTCSSTSATGGSASVDSVGIALNATSSGTVDIIVYAN